MKTTTPGFCTAAELHKLSLASSDWPLSNSDILIYLYFNFFLCWPIHMDFLQAWQVVLGEKHFVFDLAVLQNRRIGDIQWDFSFSSNHILSFNLHS